MQRIRRYNLADLAREADVTPRTVRYYIGQGLLPGPEGQGPAAHYDEGHLGRLRLIKQLQAQHLPLAEIRSRLAELDDEDVQRLTTEFAIGRSIDDLPDAGADALAYIRGVLGTTPAAPPGLAPMATAWAVVPSPAPQASRSAFPDIRPLLRERSSLYDRKPHGKPRPPGTERSAWERISLTPDIELHVRRPLDRRTNKLLERLLTAAREVFTED